jgi:hypothetical protein
MNPPDVKTAFCQTCNTSNRVIIGDRCVVCGNRPELPDTVYSVSDTALRESAARVRCPEHGVSMHECHELHRARTDPREYIHLPCNHAAPFKLGVIVCECGVRWKVYRNERDGTLNALAEG